MIGMFARFIRFVTMTVSLLLALYVVFPMNVTHGEGADEDESKCIVDETVIQEVKERKASLDKREKDIAAKEQELKARETALGEEVKKLEEIRNEITGLRIIENKKREERVAKLIETMEKMSPQAVAKMINKINDDLAVEAMSKISTERLAKIMNALDPVRSSALSEQLVALGKKKNREVSASSDVTDSSASQSVKGGDKNDGQNNERGTQSTTGTTGK